MRTSAAPLSTGCCQCVSSAVSQASRPWASWRSAAAAAAAVALSCSLPCKNRTEHSATLVGAALGRLDVDDRSVSRKPPVAVVEAIVAHRPGPKRGTIQLVLLKTVKRRVEGGRDEGVVTK